MFGRSAATAPNTCTRTSSREQNEDHRHDPVATTGRRALDFVLIQHKGNGVRDERGDRQAGDRHQALGHAREAERRQSLPERLVQRQARAERQHARHDGGEPEEEREPALTPDRPEADEGEDRGQPAEEHVLLDPCSDPAREEVGELGRVVPHLAEGAAAARDRAGDDDLLHGDRRHRRDDRARGSLPPVGARHASPGVAEREHDRPHREVDLAAERDRRERDRGPDEPAPLEREQHGRQQERDQAEQMAGRLAEPVRRQREDEAADERGAARRGRARAATSTSSAPAATIERRTTRLYAQMFPSSARSGQNGIPSSHPCRFGDASASGRNVYGSAHGAAPCSSWCPGSQNAQPSWR